MTNKQLVALIKLCRKNGIGSFKNDEVEFVLGQQPAKNVKRRSRTYTEAIINSAVDAAVSANTVADTDIDSDGWDSLSFDQQLAWSSPIVDETESEPESSA